MTEALAPLKAILRQNLAAAVDEFCDNGEDHLSLESAISTVEQYFTGNFQLSKIFYKLFLDILIKVVHSLTNSSKEQSNGQVTLQIHPSKVHLWVGSQWTQLSVQGSTKCKLYDLEDFRTTRKSFCFWPFRSERRWIPFAQFAWSFDFCGFL